MAPNDPLSNIPQWLDPALAVATFGSYRDIASYNRLMRGGYDEIPVFDSSADSAYGMLPEASIHTDYGDRGSRLIDFSSPGYSSNGESLMLGGCSSGSMGDYALGKCSTGHYVYEAPPKPADNSSESSESQNQGQNQSYTYSSFKFTLDDQGNPSFTGPTDTEHSDGKWKIQEIAAKLSDGDYTKFKKAINEERKNKGFEGDYYKDV